jgi:glucose-6-phosphate 1-dehydrogenase
MARGLLVILGASGDLTKRLLMPALYNLACDGLLAEDFAIIGMARQEWTHEEFRLSQRQGMEKFSTRRSADAARWQWLESRLYYTPGEFDDPAAYARLKELMVEVGEQTGAAGNTLLYLAISPDFFGLVNQQLAAAGFANLAGGCRLIVEKPLK